ncbi:MAG: Ig-like domain-containing protein, partial [Firmicutes bacterium]|nr:Ig-like domain-containing protein [Bacillota bacterium]
SNTFKKAETYDYYDKPSPEKCQTPAVSETVTEPGCDLPGYTTHTCSVCGNSWNDSFVLPEHVPGEWETVTKPEGGKDGLKRQTCTRCGKTAAEQVIKAVQSVALVPGQLDLSYRDDAVIAAEVAPSDAEEYTLYWTSSNDSVATVDQNGNVHAAGRGTTVITCATQDGFAKAGCTVKVDLTLKQWLIKILLFGWIWY